MSRGASPTRTATTSTLCGSSRPGPARSDRTGRARLDTLRETIRVAHGEARTIAVVQSPFGPVLYKDAAGNDYAVQWAAYRPEATDLGLLGVERARTLGEALDAANRAGVPAQNFVAGDRAGRIGWTIVGRLPARLGRDGQTPVLSTSPDALWRGFRDPLRRRAWSIPRPDSCGPPTTASPVARRCASSGSVRTTPARGPA